MDTVKPYRGSLNVLDHVLQDKLCHGTASIFLLMKLVNLICLAGGPWKGSKHPINPRKPD